MSPEKLNDIDKKVFDSKTFKRISCTFDLPSKRVLDMGCGYGSYMQRFGKNSTGITTTQDEVNYGKDIGRDIRLGNVEQLDLCLASDENFDVFWANNLFEHLLSPHAFLVNLKKFATPSSLLILGVPVVPKISNLTRIKKFRGALASPHINFFTLETLQLTSERAGWNILDARSFYFTNHYLDHWTRIFMPHIYLIAQNKSDFTYPPKKIREWEGQELYKKLLEVNLNDI